MAKVWKDEDDYVVGIKGNRGSGHGVSQIVRYLVRKIVDIKEGKYKRVVVAVIKDELHVHSLYE